MDTEGSVFNEDSDVDDSSEDSTSEDTVDTKESTGEESSEKTQKSGEEAKAESTDGTLKDQEKVEVTEKGTKLDADPMSRVNQELANERAKIREYERVLNDPSTLKKYVATFDDTEAKGKTDEPEIRVEDIQTTEDLQKYQRQQDQKVESKLKELDSTIASVKSSQKDTVVASRITSDITAVRESYPELDPKSPSYNKDLDQSVGELYELFDFDQKTNSFRGQVSIKDIADKIMRGAGSIKKQGSTEAQTTIRDKRTGKAVSGGSSTAPDESKMTAGQLIASRIQRARGGR